MLEDPFRLEQRPIWLVAGTALVASAVPPLVEGAGVLSETLAESAELVSVAPGAAANGLETGASGAASDARLFEMYKADLARQEIEGADAVGSALKDDPYHRSASFVTDMAAEGKMFSFANRTGTVNLTQVPGEMNGLPGRFEWIVDASGNLTHQMFVRGGRITGVPIAP